MPASTARTMERITFQRRHYQFIADLIRNLEPGQDIRRAFGGVLGSTNPAFDYDRFIDACGEAKYADTAPDTTRPPCLLCQSENRR